MDLTINMVDLLLLSLGVLAYAAGATLWTYLAVPAQAREAGTPTAANNAAAQAPAFSNGSAAVAVER